MIWNKYSGICSSCGYAGNCMFLQFAKEPVLECEEFEIETPFRKKEAYSAAKSVHLAKTTQSLEGDGEKHQGLCVDCESRSTCVLSTCEGGVWHCEEYR